MFQRINIAAAAAVLFLSSACAQSPQASQSGFSVPVGGAAQSHVVPPPKNCGGAGGVSVTPCPVRLNKQTKSGIVVTVSGPGVVNSYLGRINGCFNGHVCYNAEREGSSNVQWRITSGQSCGAADVEFDGVDAYGNTIGYFFLKVANKYCKRH